MDQSAPQDDGLAHQDADADEHEPKRQSVGSEPTTRPRFRRHPTKKTPPAAATMSPGRPARDVAGHLGEQAQVERRERHAARETLYQQARRKEAEADPPTMAQQQAAALGLLAETALHHGIDPG